MLETQDSLIAIDPHDGVSIGIQTCEVEADLVLVSHDHYDHNAVEVAAGRKSRVLRALVGTSRAGNIFVEGARFFHDKVRGALRGESVAYRLEVEGLKVIHLGDLGHEPGEGISFMKGADIMMIPVGGTSTIDYSEALSIVRRVKPRLILPMHYWLPGSTLPLDPLEPFVRGAALPVIYIDGKSVKISKEELPRETTIAVFR